MEVTAVTVDKLKGPFSRVLLVSFCLEPSTVKSNVVPDVKFRVSFNLRIIFFEHAAEARRELAYVT